MRTVALLCIVSAFIAAWKLKVEVRCTREAAYSHGALPNEKMIVHHLCLATEIQIKRK